MKEYIPIDKTLILYADVRSLGEPQKFARYLNTVNAERRKDAESKKHSEDRLLSLGGGLLLDRLLSLAGVTGEVTHEQNGRPCAAGRPDIHLSLTHAYPYAAAMLSGSPCGLDIESRNRELDTIAARYYTEEEKAFAGSDAARLTDIWCRKECLIKAEGFRHIRDIDTFVPPAGCAFLSFAIPGFSFEVLLKKGPFLCREYYF